MQQFKLFRGQPQSPSSGHTAFPSCFEKCVSSTSRCSWGSDGAGGHFLSTGQQRELVPALPLLPGPAGIHRRSPGREAEGGPQSNNLEGTYSSTSKPAPTCSFCPVFLSLELVLSGDRSVHLQHQAPVYQGVFHLSLMRQ